ncbi:hypothetical protein J2X57_002006 [Luteibacter sp. 1214]|uniref:hypothetical protein n=1 Tax=Luteibacter sp. 1214 TaxID=2817735 RepID=UPI002859253E|nr:hypothetical protein [Luteibacter sp. 1214]MDR6642794.1 hypothetical protein [Luteibacter sp. 1214]
MKEQIGMAATLEPRRKSTATGHLAAGLAIPRPTQDPSVLVGFIAGVILTSVVFLAAAPYIVHR